MVTISQVRKWTQRLRVWKCQAVRHKVPPALGFGSRDPDSLLIQGPSRTYPSVLAGDVSPGAPSPFVAEVPWGKKEACLNSRLTEQFHFWALTLRGQPETQRRAMWDCSWSPHLQSWETAETLNHVTEIPVSAE